MWNFLMRLFGALPPQGPHEQECKQEYRLIDTDDDRIRLDYYMPFGARITAGMLKESLEQAIVDDPSASDKTVFVMVTYPDGSGAGRDVY